MTLEEALENEVFSLIEAKVEKWKKTLSNNRTAKLWFQYQDQVAVLRTFQRSERVSLFDLYVQGLCEMHPHLAAAGHNPYTQSLALYIPEMQNLPNTHPEVYKAFNDGLFTVHRSEDDWTGIFTDTYIETGVIRSIKLQSGLTHGRGFSEIVRLLFLFSRPICSNISEAMLEFADLAPDINRKGKHKELSKARMKKDNEDIATLIRFIQERDPFNAERTDLVSLSSGLIAEKNVNCDDAKNVGEKILEDMKGKVIADYHFSIKNQVKTLASYKFVKTADGEQIELDPQLLYQRILLVGLKEYSVEELYAYELCPYPSNLFDTNLRLRSGEKSVLIHELIKLAPASIVPCPPKNQVRHVIDFGNILHKFNWPKHSKYSTLINMYVKHIKDIRS